MRLKQLRISGFKSFADTTVIEFPGAVAGIVGPNGCGKSNVIDAIRWVLGEARVSELRGSTSMSELIFRVRSIVLHLRALRSNWCWTIPTER